MTDDIPPGAESALFNIEVMTQETHDDYFASGCDPHCHVCNKKINVGDKWTLKLFVRAGDIVTPSGLVVGDVRGMCCEECAQTGRDLSPAERERLESHLREVPKKKPEPPPKAPQPEQPRSRHGCFVLPDGTRF